MFEMVVGFAFDSNFKNVLLIKKNKPEWQKGLVNGVGGKIEATTPFIWLGACCESPYEAMVREFKEETTQIVPAFFHYATINGSGWRVYFFSAVVEPLLISENPTDEELLIAPVRDLPKNTVFNLNWLIPLAIDDDIMSPTIIYDKTKYVGKKKIKVWLD